MRTERRTFAMLGLAAFALTAVLCWWPHVETVQAQPLGEHWAIEFVPRQADSVSLIIDGKVWNPRGATFGSTWERREGRKVYMLPPEFARSERMRIVAVASPWNTEAEIIVRHRGRDVRRMNFSKAEETEVIR